jgi:glycosyltransferase involved in cell wall biosynthesis
LITSLPPTVLGCRRSSRNEATEEGYVKGIEPTAAYKVIVALQEGFYGASSGSGFSNRDFLVALTQMLPPGRLVVMTIRRRHDPIDPCWTARLMKGLRQMKAQVILINGSEDPAHSRDLVVEKVADIASGSDRCLLIGLDRGLLGLAEHGVENVDLLLVPRSTALLSCAENASEIDWERDCLHIAAQGGGRVAAISTFMRRHLQEDYGVPGDALVDMRNGLLLNEGSPESPPPLPGPAEEGFLFALGRPVPDKGFEDLLEALEILRGRRVAVPHLVLAATAAGTPTEYQHHLAKVIERHGVDATLVTEFNPGIRSWMRSPALRGIVVPSRQEPFGRIPLEAFAAEAGPLVATRVGGLRETVVNGLTGFTAEPHDPPSLAEAIRLALTAGPAERGRLIRAGDVLLRERHDYFPTVRATLATVAPWALSSKARSRVR